MPKRKTNSHAADAAPAVMPDLMSLAIELVDEPPLPSREKMDGEAMNELRESMASIGLLSPIVTVKRGKRFVTVAGHRRLLAARALGWPTIRGFVYPEGWASQHAAMLHENIIREGLNPAEEAIFFAQLLETQKLDEAGICRAVKRSPEYIAERFRLLRGDERVFQKLRDGSISFAVARVLNKFTDPTMLGYYLDAAERSGTSARVVEQWFNEWRGSLVPGAPQQPAPAPQGPDAPPSPPAVSCFLCGGALDPYNLITVYVHKWELAEIRKALDTRHAEE